MCIYIYISNDGFPCEGFYRPNFQADDISDVTPATNIKIAKAMYWGD